MFNVIAEWIALVIEAGGIAIIVIGAAISTWRFLRDWVATRSFGEPYQAYRGNLGRAILLGLEFLVAADIVGTVVVDPTFENPELRTRGRDQRPLALAAFSAARADRRSPVTAERVAHSGTPGSPRGVMGNATGSFAASSIFLSPCHSARRLARTRR
jgi:uncharacterized membrane protein